MDFVCLVIKEHQVIWGLAALTAWWWIWVLFAEAASALSGGMTVAMGEDRGMGGAVTLVLAVYYSSGDNCKLVGGRDPHLISLGPLVLSTVPSTER